MKKFTTKPRLFRSSPGYSGSQAHQIDSWVYMGRLAEAGPLTDVRFDTELAHVIALFGKRGSGKSYTLGSLLEGLCTRDSSCSIAENTGMNASLLFDTLGIFQWMGSPVKDGSTKEVVQKQFAVHKGWKITPEPLDVMIWIPRGTKSASTPEGHREFTIDYSDFGPEDWGYLFGLDVYQDRMGQLLLDAFIKVTVDGWTNGNKVHKPSPEYTLSDLVECVENDQELNSTYQSETRRAILQQLRTYRRNPMFHDSGTPLKEFLKPGAMSVIVMNKMSDELRLVVVAVLMRQLIASRVIASEAEKHLKIRESLDQEEQRDLEQVLKEGTPPTWVCIDEAQNILPAERRTSATNTIVKYVREGRNYGLSFVVATQQPTAIDARILAQVDTLISHKLTVQGDIDYIRKNIKSNLPSEVKYGNAILTFDDLLRSLDVGQALVSNTETDRAYIIDVRPRVSIHGGF